MRRLFFLFSFFTFGITLPAFFASADAVIPSELNLIFSDRTIKLNLDIQKNLIRTVPHHFLILGNQKVPVDTNGQLLAANTLFPIQTEFSREVNPDTLHEFFRSMSLVRSDSETNSVAISQDKEGPIVFIGTPQQGFDIDETKLVALMNEALVLGKTYVQAPATKIFSKIDVSPELQKRGIREVIGFGESNFTGSSSERKKNIFAALRRLNGVIIRQGKNFSFNHYIQDISEKDGFVPELVIKGNLTEKELGGGICQVSTTAFRAAFFAGLPITERKNHSYTVPYYKPLGLDAAVYLGSNDFRFKNDTPGDILIQAFTTKGDNLFFVFYGTRDGRSVFAEGPFLSHYQDPGDPLLYQSPDLPQGQIQEIRKGYSGVDALWIRRLVYTDGHTESKNENFVSHYRPWKALELEGTGTPETLSSSDQSFLP